MKKIGGSTDYANNRIASWDSLKQIKLQMAERLNANRGWTLHKNLYATSTYFTGLPSSEAVDYPIMKIQAIGDGPGIVPSTGTNVVKTSFTTALSLTAPSSIPGIEIEPARIVIKPTATDSVIELKFSILHDEFLVI